MACISDPSLWCRKLIFVANQPVCTVSHVPAAIEVLPAIAASTGSASRRLLSRVAIGLCCRGRSSRIAASFLSRLGFVFAASSSRHRCSRCDVLRFVDCGGTHRESHEVPLPVGYNVENIVFSALDRDLFHAILFCFFAGSNLLRPLLGKDLEMIRVVHDCVGVRALKS